MSLDNLTSGEKETFINHLTGKVGADFEDALERIATNYREQGVTKESLLALWSEVRNSRSKYSSGSF